MEQTAQSVVEVDALEIVHKGDGRDGYPTYVVVDGKKGSDMLPPRYDKWIQVDIEAHKPVEVTVHWLVGRHPLSRWAMTTVYQPRSFSMEVGHLRIRSALHRCPCEVILDGRDIGVKSVSMKFVEGEAVWVSMVVAPWIAPVQVAPAESASLPDDQESDSPHVVRRNDKWEI